MHGKINYIKRQGLYFTNYRQSQIRFTIMRNKRIKLTGFLIIIFTAISCSSSYNPNIERGTSFKYRPGYPEVRFNAVGFLNADNTPSLNLAADIVYGSLIFKAKADSEQATIAIDFRAVNTSNDEKSVAKTGHKKIVINKKSKNIVNSQDSYIFQRQIEVSPGEYKVYFTVTDLSSDKKITRIAQTAIPDPTSDKINLTSIRMLGKNMDTENPNWQPLTTYSVGGQMDSLLFSFQVTNNSLKNPMEVQAKLVRFQSDTSAARPMYYNNYSHSSIQYLGIDYDDQTVIQKTTRKLRQKGSVFIQFRFELPERGDYRFAVHSTKNGKKLFKARDFVIMSPYYPALKTARELAAPLIYLMDEDNYEKMMSIQDPDSLKQAVDRFWLKHIGSKNKAREVLQKYYSRVEEANKQFSNFKEGWKTDTGLIYILFGPPWYVYQHVDHMKWSYAYNQQEFDRNFYFYQPKLKSKFYPFQHFIFQRSQAYFTPAYQQRQLWLTGLILQRQL